MIFIFVLIPIYKGRLPGVLLFFIKKVTNSDTVCYYMNRNRKKHR